SRSLPSRAGAPTCRTRGPSARHPTSVDRLHPAGFPRRKLRPTSNVAVLIGVRTLGPGRRLHATVIAALFISASGCAPAPGPRLEFAADPTIVLSLSEPDLGPTDSFSIGSLMLCVAPEATATIKSIAIDQPRGEIRVEAFAVRPNPM